MQLNMVMTVACGGFHLLLTALGTAAKETRYQLCGKVETAELSPVALMKLLPPAERPSKILALCTERAREKTYQKLVEEVDVPCELLDIPIGRDDHEMQEILEVILRSVPENSVLTLDLTHGLRHFPFLFFTSSLYLSALKNVEIRGAWYGMLEAKDEYENAPFVDLSVLLQMADWFQAVRTFKKLKNARPLIGMLEKSVSEWTPEGNEGRRRKREIENFVTQIAKFNNNFGAGLPMELGKSALAIEDVFRKNLNRDDAHYSMPPTIPLPVELMTQVVEASETFRYSPTVPSKGNWKGKVPADWNEIQRQALLIDTYLESGLFNNALGLMREFIISRVLISRQETGTNVSWLDRDTRVSIERKLGALMAHCNSCGSDTGPGGQKAELARSWDQITQRRNELHHHGMTGTEVDIQRSVDELNDVWIKIKENLGNDDFWDPEFGGGGGRLLISPLGLSPGLLYTALKAMTPPADICLVLTSQDGVRYLDEVIEKAGYDGKVHVKLMNKPHDGFQEASSIADECQELLLNADEVICNITGGTTALQWAISCLAERARKLSRDVRRVALVDRRSYEEQKKNPYVIGELVELDDIPKEK